MAKISLPKKAKEQAVYNTLMSSLDKEEAVHIKPWNLYKKALTIYVDSPARMYSLNLKKNKLLKILQDKLSADIINEIHLKIG